MDPDQMSQNVASDLFATGCKLFLDTSGVVKWTC